MNEFTGTIYRPSEGSFPTVAAIFKKGQLVAFRVVSSEAEGRQMIKEAIQTLPLLGDERLPRA